MENEKLDSTSPAETSQINTTSARSTSYRMRTADLAAANANSTANAPNPSSQAKATNALLEWGEKFDYDAISYFPKDKEHDQEIHDFWHRYAFLGVIHCFIRRYGPDEASSVLMIGMLIHKEADHLGFLRAISDTVPEHLKEHMRMVIYLNPSPEELPAVQPLLLP